VNQPLFHKAKEDNVITPFGAIKNTKSLFSSVFVVILTVVLLSVFIGSLLNPDSAQSQAATDTSLGEIETTNIFPSRVSGDDWDRESNALTQDLSNDSLFQEFSIDNAAYLGDIEEYTETTDTTIDPSIAPEDNVAPDSTPTPVIEEAPVDTGEEPVSYLNRLELLTQLPVARSYPLAQLTLTSTTEPVLEEVVDFVESTGDAPTDESVLEPDVIDEVRPSKEIVLEGFDTPALDAGQFVDGMQLRVSMAARMKDVVEGAAPYVEVFLGNSEGEQSIGIVLLDGEVSNALNGGYYLFALPSFIPVDKLAETKVTLRYFGDEAQIEALYLDAAWIEMTTKEISKEELLERGTAENLVHLEAPELSVLVSDQLNFARTENPVFNLRYEPQQNFILRGFFKLLGKSSLTVKEVYLVHETVGEVAVHPNITITEDGLITLEVPESELEMMVPGTYSVNLIVDENGDEFTDTFDFQWGILGLNPHKSEYQAGEIAKIAIGALSQNGNTVCDARLDLYVTDPAGMVSKIPVNQSGECNGNNVVSVPDYTAEYVTGASGEYEFYLERLDEQGALLSFTTDTILVVDQQRYSIERSGPTRIYPVAPYEMSLTVKASEGFSGVLRETVPASFEVGTTTAQVTVDGEWKTLTWDLSLSAGESSTVSYGFDAPDISPYLYMVGSAELESGAAAPVGVVDTASTTMEAASSTDAVVDAQEAVSDVVSEGDAVNIVFREHRRWQIASDATGSMILMWDGGTIPTGWTCVSCTGGDVFYQRFIVGSSTVGVTGGAATHTHTAAATVAVTGNTVVVGAGGANNYATVGHTHTLSPTIGAASNLPAYRNLVIIQNNSAGEPTSIPAGAIAIFDASVPVGWTQYSAQNGFYVRGESIANRGVTGGSNTHTHTISGTTANNAGVTNGTGGGAISIANNPHSHTVSSNTASQSNEPPYIETILGKLNSTTTMPDNAITMWSDDVPSGWTHVSTSSAALQNRFFKPAATYGTTGGVTNHTPANVLGIVSSAGSSASPNSRGGTGTTRATGAHTHSVDVTGFSNATHLPPYRSIIFGKRAGGMPPNAPTLHTLFDDEKTGTSTPSFEFTADDPYGVDTLVYQFQWDDDTNLDDAPLGNRASDVETGCSPNCFINTVTGGDVNPFNENERIRFTIQSPLTNGETYFFRVRAKKTVGGVWGTWSTVKAFTYVSDTDPSQWLQTVDDQFSKGVLFDTEVFGSDSVRILQNTPDEALIVYGEGSDTTPRFRTWNGTAWSAESTTLDVGGVIQWVRVKPGTTRDEYVVGTHDANNDVNVQIFNAASDTWGSLQEVTAAANDTTRRAFDVAYETTSGDAMVAYCNGTDAAYRIWNGTSWSGATTITTASPSNCHYIALASDPTTDEIVLVTRDTGANATDYEALVWNGSSWGNSVTMGVMTDLNNEGIAVAYEESGGQALVTVSNGGGASFLWTAWNGTEWSTPVAQGIGNDYQWGTLKADVGSDNMALCYVDTDTDIGIVRWNGETWQTAQEFETVGYVDTGRGVSCEFETTSGRDGYIMIPYSDSTNARWQAWNGTALSGESSISTITEAWEVGTARTGDGKVLSYFHDSVNTQYDFSYWNGTVWSTIQTLEITPSVTATPFRQPVNMAAQVFVPSRGTITSDPVPFNSVPNRSTWGEAIWSTTEPNGTDVKLQVLYATTSACNVLVPDGALPGNSAGFDAGTSPLNLSTLATSTYANLCLRATLTSTNQSTPTLDDWTISWERQPFLVQTNFRWYANRNSENPNDAWPVGATDLAQNATVPQEYSPGSGDVMRLRMAMRSDNAPLLGASKTFKLQYAEESGLCASSTAWFDVGSTGSTTALWRGYNNLLAFDGSTLSTLLLGTDVGGTYEEENNSNVNPNTVAVGNEGEWDWVLEHNGAADGVQYCFRMVTAAGEELSDYDQYPALLTNTAPVAPTLEKRFDNEQVASTSPWFEFVAEDAESDDVSYQIQIDDTYDFSSTALDRNSTTNFSEFENIVTPSDKDAFTVGQTVRFKPSSALSNNITYYWRVRAKDGSGSNTWGDWSTIYSFRVNTGTTVTTWHQTEQEQFATNDLSDTEATGSDDVALIASFLSGTTTGTSIDFDDKTTGNAWGSLSWNNNVTTGSIRYRIEYLNNGEWELVPNTFLPGNSTGFTSSPVSLLGLDPQVHNEIRVRANLTDSGGTPRLLDWTVQWGYAVEQPTLVDLFDNEKVGTTTPTFRFDTVDPESNDLQYQISWSTDNTFAGASTSMLSGVNAGFADETNAGDTSPFASGDDIRFKIQPANALTNNTTYWWRVRARDPFGGNVWSVWSEVRSFTVDTTVGVSTWYQTTDEQFETNTLTATESTGSDSVEIASIIREAFMAYAEGTIQTPRYRLWNGSTWGVEQSALSVGSSIRFVETATSDVRDEYMIVTQEGTGRVRAQVYDGVSATAGDLHTVVAAVPSTIYRGFDVAYESNSGDVIVVACSGTEAVYSVWNGTSWSGPTALTLAVAGNCNWIQLASDPTSDEIILVARDTIAGATDYEAQVWNGSAWGNSVTFGVATEAADEGIAIEYEESGDRAVVVLPNTTNASFLWNSWNGTAWSGAVAVAIQDDYESGRLARDVGTDNMVLCEIDQDGQIAYIRWNGATNAWVTPYTTLDVLGNDKRGRPFGCQYETTPGRDGFIMMPYSDTGAGQYRFFNGTVLSAEAAISTIQDSFEIRTTRTGDGSILALFYDDINTQYDFSYWNGTVWSTLETLEATSITTTNPPTIPLDIVARQYPTFTQGTVVSTPIDFDDGSGLKWQSVTFADTTPGSSEITYQIEYYDGDSWELIPNGALAGNSTGFTSSPIDISTVSRITYNTIRLKASLACVAGNCPTLNDWTVTWSEGIIVSGTTRQYNQTSSTTAGTVAVAVNGVLQTGKTGTINSNGVWSIANVTAFEGDIVTVFVQSAADSAEAVAVTRYDGDGDITGLTMFERHLTLGSNDATSTPLTNANIGLYDFTQTEDIFFNGNGTTLSMCVTTGCADAKLYVRGNVRYVPGGRFVTHDFVNFGYFTAGSFTHEVNGSWDNNATSTMTGSTVVFAATSTTESVDSTGATVAAFNNISFGTTTGSASWTLGSTLDVDGTLTVTRGTLARANTPITIGAGLFNEVAGVWTGRGTTTFDGGTSATWRDQNASLQNVGRVVVDGTSKAVTLASNVAAESIFIGANDTLDASTGNYDITVFGNWRNDNNFVARLGEVFFAATSTGKTITTTGDPFYDVSFSGSGGGWSFTESTVNINNDFRSTAGTVTLPTATSTIAGSFLVTLGTFQHNNGSLYFTSGSSENITFAGTAFTNVANSLWFQGAGNWTITDTNATSTNNVVVQQGTLNLPSGVLAIGGTLRDIGGVYAAGTGTVRFYSATSRLLTAGGSSFNNVTFYGAGAWSFTDTNISVTRNLLVQQGTLNMPSIAMLVAGSYDNNATVVPGTGTLQFNSNDGGETIDFGNSPLYNVVFNNVNGGWTITENATTTNALTITAANSLTVSSGKTVAVGNTFTNSVGGAATTWTGSTLSLYGGNYSLNTKANAGDVYSTLRVAANTDIKMWNSSSTNYVVNGSGSLYSQDHSAVDGDLYIWGAYERTAGNEHWSYATDFDGTSLGGSSRQVDVRFASGASATFVGASLQVVGTSANKTTINGQSSSDYYGVTLSNSTINAEQYTFDQLNATGLVLNNGTIINSLENGHFTLSAVGGTSITLSTTTIDANPALQIYDVTFDTTLGTVIGGSGVDTFEFFDDFADGTIDTAKWTKDIELGAISETGGYLRAGGGITTGNYGHTSLGSEIGYSSFLNNAVMWRARNSADGIGEMVFRGDYGTNRGYKARFDARTGTNGQAILEVPYSGWTISNGTGTCASDSDEPVANTWYDYQVTASSSNYKFYRNSVLKRDCTDTTTLVSGEIALQNHFGSYTDYDWVAVRKFVNPEPTHSTWGSEEEPTTGLFRKSHTISGTTAGLQTDYVLPVTVNFGSGTDSGQVMYCNSKCNGDFSDVGFTDASGNPLSFWREESYVASSSATFWVKFNSIPASPGTTNMYMYYGETGGFNVTVPGVTEATSYVWFRNHLGNHDGEAFDNDIGAGAGDVRWDDSPISVTLSGTVYSDAGVTPLAGGTCDGVTQVVRAVVQGGASFTGSCSNVNGSFSIPGVTFTGDPVITVYLDNASGGERGSVVTQGVTGDIANLDIYSNRVIVRNEGNLDPLTIDDMAVYDSDNDSDIRFTATNASTDTLRVMAGNELFVFATSTFTPGGVVTLDGNAQANGYDGTLSLGNGTTFNAYATSTLTVGGRFVMASGATFNPASTTVLMNATTSGKSITAVSGITLNELTFNGAGGTWNIGAALTLSDDMNITAGTVTGTSNITLSRGALTGNGILSLGAGTTTIARSSNLGGTSPWTFYNLQLGNGVNVGTTTPVFTATTTVAGRLTIAAAHYLDAGATTWDLSGAGTVFVENGTFLEDTSTVRYSGPGANVRSTGYHNLDIQSGAGSQTYVGTGLGIVVNNNLTIGGAAASSLNLTTSDPAFDVNGSVTIRGNGTLVASDTAVLSIAGSYTNNGVFTSNNGTVVFDGAGTTNISAGGSSFGTVRIAGTAAVTVAQTATTTGTFRLSSATSFTVASGQTLAVQGNFINAVNGAITTWTGATLRLFGNGNYLINNATTSDAYGTVSIDGTTQIRMWNSSASTYDVDSTASLYSQDHLAQDGDLYIWGSYKKSSGVDYWSYGTDFDGTTLGGVSRKVDVFFASGASAAFTGGNLAIIGASAASTTLQNQGSGSYGFTVGGNASTTFRFFEVTDTNSSGLVFTGAPTVHTLSNGSFGLAQTGGSTITVGGTVITQNPAKNFNQVQFYLDGAASGFNVTATGTSVSAWRFANHYGDIDGESFDVDPNGDPGYVAWDDSAALITVSGRVFSDEGSTVSTVCDGVTNNVTLRVAGITSYSTSCNAGTGAYSISGVSYGVGDSLVVYIDNETEKGAHVTIEPISNITNFDIYENRVIVRHENTNPITIDDLAVWDSSDDADVPFTAVNGAPDTLTLPANRKLLVATSKTFEPGGNVTLTGAGAGAAFDGTLELQSNAVWQGQGTETLSVGGSMLLGTSATFNTSNGTTTFTTSGAARTIDLNEHDLYSVVFSGSGSWTITDPTFTVGGNFSKTAGTLTFPTGTSTFNGSFTQSAGSFVASGGVARFTGTGGRTLTMGGSDLHTMQFAGGNYAMTDVNATSTASVTINSGTVTLPSGFFSIAGNFRNVGGAIAHNTSELVLRSPTTGVLLASSSDLFAVRVSGGGAYTMQDNNVTFLDDVTITSGSMAFASGTVAVGGSWNTAGGTFSVSTTTILFNSADGGEIITPGSSSFYSVQVGAPTGGYTLAANATTTRNFTLSSAASFTVSPSVVLKVLGVFSNNVGGTNTTWNGSTLALYGSTTFSLNGKTTGADRYNILAIGPNTDIRMWNSSATTTTINSTASLYSQDHNAVNGALSIYGDFHIGTTTEYWSYATDFDGTSLSGSERVVTVAHAANATTTLDGGTLNIVGTSGNQTTITNQGSGTYAMRVTQGTFNAQYYRYRNLNSGGLTFAGAPSITSLSNGDFELAVGSGSLMTVSSSTINANASFVITGTRFATTSAITGKNVTVVGATSNAWTFVTHTGNLDGEAYDDDGGTACGAIRWSDSSCLITQQTQYRWRNDDGGLGVPDSEWFNTSWDARKAVRIDNADTASYTNAVVELTVPYDSDMQADFDDLRFTADDGVTPIPYWIGSSTNSTVAEVWVKVPSLPAESSATVYMYYYNPTAPSGESVDDTFLAADDFEDNDISEYSGQTALFSTGASFAHDGGYGLDNNGDESGRASLGGIYRTDQGISQGETIRYWQYVDTSAGSGDETCTKFGVQSGSPNSNYAVCIEQFGTDRLSLVRNAVENDTSGTILASSTVSYVTGWYEIEVDWEADDDIIVSLYNAAGTLVTTISDNDTTYSSGGLGFSYWFHYGGWDSFSSRPTLTTEPAIRFGAEQGDGGGSWKAAQNAPASYDVGDVARLRIAIENSGLAITAQQFLLEFAPMGVAPSCEAVSPASYVAVPNQASCGSSAVCMTSSTLVTNGAATGDLLFNTLGLFTAGQYREDPSNSSSAFDVGQDQYTELEYALTTTSNVSDENMCFRVTNNGTDFDTYLRVARLSLQFDPEVGSVALNGGADIALLPGATTTVYATGTVSDLNGYADLLYATSTVYRSGAAGGAACTANNNDCYISSGSQCTFTSCSGNSCEVSCRADIYYHADATDIGSSYPGEEWYAFIEVEDSAAGYDFGTTLGVEMLSLRAIEVAGNINYGALEVSQDTGSTNASTTVDNQGNTEINVEVEGTNMSDGTGSQIPSTYQKFATSTFNYSGCGVSCYVLSSTSPFELDLELAKPTVSAPPVSDSVYWGIAVPFGVKSTPHQGVNVFTPVSP
jgi:Domain of unknown function (DUF2341)